MAILSRPKGSLNKMSIKSPIQDRNTHESSKQERIVGENVENIR
jgi:hypothetical protein